MSDSGAGRAGTGGQANRNEAAKPAEGAKPAEESSFKKISYAIAATLLTTLAGTTVTSFFQQNSQSYQKRIDQIAVDVKSARDAQSAIMKLVDNRFMVASRYAQALDRRAAGKDPQGLETKAAAHDYDATLREWETQFDDVATRVAFDIDAPFQIERFGGFDAIYRQDCQSYTLGDRSGVRDGAVSASARAILEVLNHCHDLFKEKLGAIASATNIEAKAAREAGRRIREHIYRVNEVLRCTIIARVVLMQRSAAKINVLSWLIPSQNDAAYTIPDEDQKCVDSYRDDKVFGANASAPVAPIARP